MHVFGANAYMHVPKQLWFKINSKSKLYKFLGYDLTSKAYRLWDLESRKSSMPEMIYSMMLLQY
jgi:hypothetical protein